MLMRTRWLMEQNGGRGVTFATGTPVSNTVSELYSLQRYLQPDELKERGIENFDAWAGAFADTETNHEKTATGEYKPVTRLSTFVNLPELKAMTRQFLDVRKAKDLITRDRFGTAKEARDHAAGIYKARYGADPTDADLASVGIGVTPHDEGGFVAHSPQIVRPRRVDHVDAAPKSAMMDGLMQSLKQRAESLKGKGWKGASKGDDNMLAICTDGRKGSIDMRMVNAESPDDPDSKLNRMVRNVSDIYHKNPGKTQMVFSDLGANPQKNGFHPFKDIIDKLVASGIPRNEIVDFSKVKNDKERAEWTQHLREGKVRVALGGTDTLGTGVNAQNKLFALHHLDVPHRPSDLEQRDGRGWRHGNENKHVHIYKYVTKGSLDEMFWQNIARKARFINQVISSDEAVDRSAREEDAEELSPEHIMAAASGDPRILERVQLDEDVRSLGNARVRHEHQQHDYARKIKDADEKSARIKQNIEDWKATIAHLEKTPDFQMEINDQTYDTRKDADEALRKHWNWMQEKGIRQAHVGHYRGLPLVASYGQYHLKTPGGQMSYGAETLASLESRARNLESDRQAAENTLDRHEKDMAQIRERHGKPFPKQAEYEKKSARLKQLMDELIAESRQQAEAEPKED
jgi:hypothetical protein